MKWQALWDDGKTAARRVLRHPSSPLLVALTVAVAIGAVTGVFDVAYNLLHRPLPYRQPSRIVVARYRTGGFLVSDYNWQPNPSAGDVFRDLAEFHLETVLLRTHSGLQHTLVARVTPQFFSVLGVHMALGSGLPAALPPGPPEAPTPPWLPMVISQRMWRQDFNSSPSVIGSEIHLRLLYPYRFQIVGVAPAGVRLPPGVAAWIPEGLTTSPVAQSAAAPNSVDTTIGRLLPGVTIPQAEAAMRSWPRQNPLWTWLHAADLVPLRAYIAGGLYQIGPWLWLISMLFLALTVAAAVGICRLSLEARREEFRIRSFLGAGSSRLLRACAFEVAGPLAMALPAGLVVRLAVIRSTGALLGAPPSASVRGDGLELAMALATAGLAALLILLPEAHNLGVLRLPAALGGSRAAAPLPARRGQGAGFFLQVLTATVILAAAAMLLRSAYAMAQIRSGVRPAGVYVADVTLPIGQDQYVSGVPGLGQMSEAQRDRVAAERTIAFAGLMAADFSAIQARLRGRAGVTAAGTISLVPYSGYVQSAEDVWVSRTPQRTQSTPMVPAHIETMDQGAIPALGWKLLYGRNFAGSGRNTVIVSQALARSIAPGAGSLGWFIEPPGEVPARIIGIVANVHGRDLLSPPQPAMYYPIRRWGESDVDLVIRTSGGITLARAAKLIRSAADAVVPGATVTRVRSLAAMVASAGALMRFCERLLLILAGLGICMVGACAWAGAAGEVRRREYEIGVRLALGAQISQIAALILGGELWPSLPAAGLGALAAWWLARAALHLIPGVRVASGNFVFALVAIELFLLAVANAAFSRAMRKSPRDLLSRLWD